MPETILNIDPTIDLKQCLLWQYQNSANLKSLILSKEQWYQTHHAQFWQDWYDNVFNIDTANDFGLSVWGQILDFSRSVKAKDGSLHYLTTEQYRLVLKGQMLRFGMGATAPEINKWLSLVFAGKGQVYCLDSYDMSAIPFVFRSEPSDEIKWLVGNIDFFPRPAGVGYQVRIIPNDVFGFNGSGLQPFNQGVFANDYSDVLQPALPDMYQFHINAPAGATVKINGEIKNWELIEKNESYTWSVEQDGYISAGGSGTMLEDKSIDISALRITNTSGIGTVFINNQTAVGAFFETGTSFNFNYSVGLDGYLPLTGNGVISNSRIISVSRLLISPNPVQSTVLLNGEEALGAFFLSGTVFEYSYTVSYPGLIDKSGSGYVTNNAVIDVAPSSGTYSISNIQTNSTGGVVDVGSYTVPLSGLVGLTMAAERGRYVSYDGADGAKATVSNLSVNAGDVLRFVKISGGYATQYNLFNGLSVGGSGLALYINGVLRLVVGGGGGCDTNSPQSLRTGGGGYVGGNGNMGDDVENQHYNGYSVDGSSGRSTSNVLLSGDGRARTARINNQEVYVSYGGSGYNMLPGSASVDFSTNPGAGYVNLTFNPS